MKPGTMRCAILLLSLLMLIRSSTDIAEAQTATPSPTPSPVTAASTTTASPVPTPINVPEPVVTAIVEGHLELDVIIRVQVEHLDVWSETNDPTKLVPYINGRAIRGNYPDEIHASKNHIYFHLEILPENKEIWTDLLGEPSGMKSPVTFSVGTEQGSPFDSVFDQSNRQPLVVISPPYGVLALVVILATLIVFVWLARKTSIIRDAGPKPIGGKLKPYNLGRTQMAIWFFLIYVSYQAIWLVTGDLNTITASLLALMGISAGTALSDALIDSGKETTNSEQLQTLTAEKQALEQVIIELQTRVTSTAPTTQLSPEEAYSRDELNKQLLDSRIRLNQITQQLNRVAPTVTTHVSAGFLRDVLSDTGGYSFHRFQIFAWTIVLGIIFLSSVYNGLTMPEFSPTLLGLMGISSGTYLGFKFPEKK